MRVVSFIGTLLRIVEQTSGRSKGECHQRQGCELGGWVRQLWLFRRVFWIPAFAGMTGVGPV